ncbi:hypothetical protein TRFO_12516 [Tritrichomonas foetus]|uniref:Uncharacterized protein n=1 Tax=Tritrichomonas foetus TaxID=1144522 RepID=A0A1J4L5W5_9EUKA|nr:hypothetical protein TRFO_12516 [Tritrichomonas foetus]|eukprot:OHT17342.1 hypothetical protein TRFO_12516 [Tritrichomonas foetus]
MESKKISLPEIEKIVSAGRDSAKHHMSLAHNMTKFADSFVEMCHSECPEFLEKAKQIAALIKGAMDQEVVIANAELRLAEDLNDLSVRYDVLVKHGNEVNSKKSQLESAKRKISEIERQMEVEKLKGGLKTYKLQGDLTTVQQKKTEATRALETLLERFITMREKYAVFKVRRLEHGYKNLGQQVEKALEIEKHLIGQLKRDCEQARDNIDDYFHEESEHEADVPQEIPDDEKPKEEEIQ